MLDKIRNFFKRDKTEAPSRIDRLTYAVGDIHGRANLLDSMLAAIRTDAETFETKPRVVLLGDYIDRGNGSDQVLETILKVKADDWCDLILLMGNHEESLLAFLNDAPFGAVWMEHGGDATLAAYGVQRPHPRATPKDWEATQKAFADEFPEAHRQLLQDMQMMFIAGDYLFVHAGVKPGQPLDAQDARTFLWIRSEFLDSPKACDYVVVHGHTPEPEVSNLRWRIGLDTGAYATGILSAVRLHETTRHLIQVR